VLTFIRAARHPRPITIQLAALFGFAALNIALTWVFGALHIPPPEGAAAVAAALVLAIPYLLVRLVHEFAGVPFLVLRATEAALITSILDRFVAGAPFPLWGTAVLIGYFFLASGYATVGFAAAAKSAVGLTARQMGAVAIGCGSLAGAIFLAGVRALFPDLIPPVGLLSGPAGLAAGVAFYLGFATPRWLQRS